MKKIVGLILSVLTISVSAQSKQDKVVLVIHGGAGTILKKHMTAEKEKAYREALTESLTKGFEVIKKGGESEEAVIEAIKVMEDSPLFNAGKGAVFTHEGKNEMDASLMLGHTMQAGAVAGVTTIKNPITAAKTVLRNSAHVMMVGKGAEEFAQKQLIQSMAAHEAARLKALSQSRYIVPFQPPTLPEESLYPRPFLFTALGFLLLLIVVGLCSLILAAIKDHMGV